MRVTAEAKESTRKKILETAQELFRSDGFESTTTRDIARAAGIATGTLFNYFPTKEAIVTGLIIESLARRSASGENAYESLEEALFANAAASLRVLKPYRKYLTPVLETSLSPLAETRDGDVAHSLRTEHLEIVVSIARDFGLAESLTPVAMQMYWSLYLGVLTFWANDKSSKQEETLALLDHSITMFVSWLRAGHEKKSR